MTKTINFVGTTNQYYTSVLWDLNFEYINIYADSDNIVNESIETDNSVYRRI